MNIVPAFCIHIFVFRKIMKIDVFIFKNRYYDVTKPTFSINSKLTHFLWFTKIKKCGFNIFHSFFMSNQKIVTNIRFSFWFEVFLGGQGGGEKICSVRFHEYTFFYLLLQRQRNFFIFLLYSSFYCTLAGFLAPLFAHCGARCARGETRFSSPTLIPGNL